MTEGENGRDTLALGWSAPLCEHIKQRMMKGWTPPLGIRISNPAYLRVNERVVFKGQEGRTETGLMKFATPFYGIRTLALIVGNYLEYNRAKSISDVTMLLMRDEPLLTGHAVIYMARVLQHSQDGPYDFSLKGADFAQAYIGYKNRSASDATAPAVYYEPKYVAEAVHLSHIQ